MTPDPTGIDTLICLHARAAPDQVGRSVFSLVLQDHQPVHVILACQGLDAEAQEALRLALAPIMAINPSTALTVLHGPPAGDAALLNRGLAAMRGRHAALLACGDVLYPEAYRLLIAELHDSHAAIAAAGVLDAFADHDGLLPYVIAKAAAPATDRPVHGLLLDRTRIAPADLQADADPATDPSAQRRMLARLCARYPVAARLHGVMIGERLWTGPPPAMLNAIIMDTPPCEP